MLINIKQTVVVRLFLFLIYFLINIIFNIDSNSTSRRALLTNEQRPLAPPQMCMFFCVTLKYV